MTRDLAWLTARPIAHRGLHDGNTLVWENTLSAFALAAQNSYAIECDVQLSSDNVVMVFHDNNLLRLTGVDAMLHERTARQLSALRIGGSEDRVPHLRDLLDLAGGRVPLVIELKGNPGHDGGLVEAVAKDLAGYKGDAAIMSFDHHLLRQCRSSAPGVPLGLTAEGMREQDIEAHFSMLAHSPDFVSYSIHHLPNRFVDFARQTLKLPVITWTVNTQGLLAKTYREADQATFEGMLPP